ncbi:MAG: sulfur relay protein DsrC [Candidatus Muproteobacteria bacterium RIFCSPHIGHO2_12_FULL_60_33]|uniref:Sulfur relay protein DsrC n=1 Tax=Candidatus Muproteobacteria bacterium RIFCSPLOWO2_01_FULL_60_18 TaxID=1817768 RepID=A0A1F6U613_9PROT|nr:MAG: sulfur relay protein DsrC [Candidatus Muproteobacteria bacterium RIFCSPHIGHO2_01_60_12]OGI52794.1 MAG: sulfur relay protein DsrC [Candidatus Muproteobacteria bacterium RIFCSPLOWO2_01_FULL_60_18]OGI54936.1 MAG: sulfur relay protein DsrC [Candidatus Muproteobacteria bacterium RIFCSPHIGHO2_02_FULL_60_13]OGI55696.1 MAG: sulfur relay protein DsrC [Candidatus Muproteobacteria bacterium RIFCSPHIGHO2_12_FULL_60_33]OGI58961.1 MAG: sulfur relay protein DsrC [Candidatus Muproteobacteria bacterium 
MIGIVPTTFVRKLNVNGKEVFTDSEGYILNRDEWSEDFANALARQEQLQLTDEHWEIIRFLRDFFGEHGVQANVREMIKHFRKKWGPEKGGNRYLHEIFPRGGPQKQGNRLAGLLRTKGEH